MECDKGTNSFILTTIYTTVQIWYTTATKLVYGGRNKS